MHEHLSLNQVDWQYRNGHMTLAQVTAYLRRWNATPGRFTQAVIFDGAVRNYDVEVRNYPPAVEREFGVQRGDA